MGHQTNADLLADMSAKLERAKARLLLAEETYETHLKRLLPIASEVLPSVFEQCSAVSSAASSELADARKELTAAREIEMQQQRAFEDARRTFEEFAETERRRMISTPEYEAASKGAASAETTIKSVDMQLQALESAYTRAARNARQNPLARLLLPEASVSRSSGIFAGAVQMALEQVRRTEWFAELDAPRKEAELTLNEKRKLKDALVSELNVYLSTIAKLRKGLESSLEPERAQLAKVSTEREEALGAKSRAEERVAKAEEALKAIELMRDPVQVQALRDLEAILFAEATQGASVHRAPLQTHASSREYVADLYSAAADRDKAQLRVDEVEERIAKRRAHGNRKESAGLGESGKEISGIFEAAAATSLASAVTVMAVAEAVMDSSPTDDTPWQDSNPFSS